MAILTMATGHEPGRADPKTAAARRWLPWLAAYSGARIGELAQLRREDIRREGALWVARITPEAGPVKTKEAREFPLHHHLVEMGFPDFVVSSGEGYLFLRAPSRRDVVGPLRGLKNRLREFARSAVSDPNVNPNHGWRHRFKTLSREIGMDPRIMDAIQGHAGRTESDAYGDVTVKAMAVALARFPRQGSARVFS